jgi:hypothetical protein
MVYLTYDLSNYLTFTLSGQGGNGRLECSNLLIYRSATTSLLVETGTVKRAETGTDLFSRWYSDRDFEPFVRHLGLISAIRGL